MTADPSAPLSAAQIETARAVAHAMRDALHLLFEEFPADERTAKVLAANLSIDGVVARRLVRAANQSGEPLALLTRLPSVDNLRKVLRAALAKGISPTITADLHAAIDAFAALAESLGPAKAELTRRVRATIGAGGNEEGER